MRARLRFGGLLAAALLGLVLAAPSALAGETGLHALRVTAANATADTLRGAGHREPINLKAGRIGATLFGVDLYSELARVDGPVTPSGRAVLRRRGFTGPNFHGHGYFGSARTDIGGVGLLFEYKDYDALLFSNDDDKALILPPATLRDHTFNLLNRHPHQLDTTDDEAPATTLPPADADPEEVAALLAAFDDTAIRLTYLAGDGPTQTTIVLSQDPSAEPPASGSSSNSVPAETSWN